MKILLIANYIPDGQQSMQRFADMLQAGFVNRGHEVKISRPGAYITDRVKVVGIAAKWLGYLDKFLLYPSTLRREIEWADVVHICDHSNAMYLPHVSAKPNVITCHDLLAIRAALNQLPQHVPSATGRFLQRWILKNLQRAGFVACVSEKTHFDLVGVGGNSSQVSVVIPNAINYPYHRLSEAEKYSVLGSVGISEGTPFIFHVGGNQWYKNRLGVIQIYYELLKYPRFSNLHLVMAGKPLLGDARKLIADLKIEARVIELVNVTNELLCALYSAAEGLLFPSLQEGFGWPIIEAQVCECLVMTSSLSPMTEVAGGGAIFIHSANPASSAQRIFELFGQRQEIVRVGSENAKLYSPNIMLEAYESLYSKAIKSRER